MNVEVTREVEGFAVFNDDRQQIQNWIVEVIENEYKNSIMKEMILPFFANPKGKKLRPLIFLNTFKMIYGEEIEESMMYKVKNLAPALEISHNASLMIDDVFDRDVVRRGENAFHVEFGTFAALSAGYNLSAFVFDLATRTDNHEVVRTLGKVGTALSSALFMSKDLVSKKKISRAYFMDLLYRKTSALFTSCSKSAALIATEDRKIIEMAEKFGEYFGTAYQLRDDVLAIIGTQSDLGKPPYSDITNRFQSLITIEAMERASEENLLILEEFYLKNVHYEPEIIRDILIRSGAVEVVKRLTIDIRNQARDILKEFKLSNARKKLEVLLDMINFD